MTARRQCQWRYRYYEADTKALWNPSQTALITALSTINTELLTFQHDLLIMQN